MTKDKRKKPTREEKKVKNRRKQQQRELFGKRTQGGIQYNSPLQKSNLEGMISKSEAPKRNTLSEQEVVKRFGGGLNEKESLILYLSDEWGIPREQLEKLSNKELKEVYQETQEQIKRERGEK